MSATSVFPGYLIPDLNVNMASGLKLNYFWIPFQNIPFLKLSLPFSSRAWNSRGNQLRWNIDEIYGRVRTFWCPALNDGQLTIHCKRSQLTRWSSSQHINLTPENLPEQKKIVKSQELQYANEIFVKIAKLLEALVAHMGIPRLLSKPDKTWSLTVEGTQHVAVGSFSSS